MTIPPTRPTPPPPDKDNMPDQQRPSRAVPEPRRVNLPQPPRTARATKQAPEEPKAPKPVKKEGFWTRPKLFILGAAVLILAYALWGFMASQQNTEEQQVIPTNVPSTSAPSAAPSASVSASPYGIMSSSDRAIFYAQYAAEAFVTAYFNRSAEQGSVDTLNKLKPTLTAAAYKKAQDEVSRWPWDKCAATNCQVHAQILNVYTPEDLPAGETAYVVQISMSEGPESNPKLLPQLLYRIHVYPTSDDGTKWLVDDYTRIQELSSD